MADFKWAVLPENPTKEDLKKEIERLEMVKTDYANLDDALKKGTLNSAYGVLGLVSFICYHRDVAQTITMQSADLIQYTIRMFDRYFNEVLPECTELLAQVGITNKPEFRGKRFVNYADTDSLFIVFDDYYEMSDKSLDMNTFFLRIYNGSMKQFIVDQLKEYCVSFGAFTKRPDMQESFMLDLENVCHSVLWTAKKKYIKDVSWEKGKTFKPQANIKIKGLDANQSATPKFCRDKMKEVIKHILENDKKIDEYKLSVLMKSIKDQFMKMDIDAICRTERITEYAKHVITDTARLEFRPGAKPHVKGAGYYNYLLYSDKDLQAKYPFLITSTKVRWYYTLQKTDLVESFAFLPGEYPTEIAPSIDYDLQFEKTFLGPMNRILEAIGLKQMDPEQVYFESFGW